MTCDDTRIALGAYLLGALDPVERAATDSHLAGCPACRDELAGLAALPGLLGRLTLDEVEGQPLVAGEPLLDRLLTRVRHEQRRTRVRQRLAYAAAAVVAAAAVATGVLVGGRGGATTEHWAATFSATNSATHVHAVADIRPRAWGTEVALTLSGVPPEEHCQLVAVSREGRREVAGSWEATYAGQAQVQNATSIAPTDLAELDVITLDGRRLLQIPVSS